MSAIMASKQRQELMHFKLSLVLSQLLLHMLSGLLADQVQYCMCT